MADDKLASAFEKALQKKVREEVRLQIEPLKAEIARLERSLRTADGRPPRGKAGPKTGSQTAASAKLTPTSIKRMRKRLGLSQAELARLTGVTPVAVYFWESGRTKPRGASVDALVAVRGLNAKQARRKVGG
jgi:DNA-binding transcriptional regulator YiaG